MLTLEKMRNPTGKLDDLDPTLDAAHRIGNRLSMLFRDQPSKLLRMRVQQRQEFLHHTRSPQRGRIAPGWKRSARGLNGAINVGRIGHRDVANHVSRGRIRDFAGSRAFSSDRLAADPQWNGLDLN